MSGYIILSDHKRHYFDLPVGQVPRIETIAHALSNINRWTGHTIRPFSVAQHSLLVSYLVPPEFALEALLHDATEAYLGDIASPLKALLPEYQRLEAAHWVWIAEAFGLPTKMSPEVKHADMQALALEKYYHMGDPASERDWPAVKAVTNVDSLKLLKPMLDIYDVFMKRYWELVPKVPSVKMKVALEEARVIRETLL